MCSGQYVQTHQVGVGRHACHMDGFIASRHQAEVNLRGAGFLLGSGGADGEAGALAAFVPERAARHELIAAIAEECAGAAQTEEAVELFMYAGQPRPALHMLSHQLSDLIEPSLDDAVAGALLVPTQAPACAACHAGLM